MKTYTIQKDDVGKFQKVIKCHCCDQTTVIYFNDVLGTIQQGDVGKKMKRVDGIWYVGNDQQFKIRTKWENKKLCSK